MSRPFDDNLDVPLNTIDNNYSRQVNEFESQKEDLNLNINQLKENEAFSNEIDLTEDENNNEQNREQELQKQRDKVERLQSELEHEKNRLQIQERELEEEKNKDDINGMNHVTEKMKKNEYFKTNQEKREEEKKKKKNKDLPDDYREVEEKVISEQADEAAIMNGVVHNINSTFRNSEEFSQVRYYTGEYEEFMHNIKGRTNLTVAELKKYDFLTMQIEKSCDKYLNKKQKEKQQRKKDGKKESNGEYEETRIKGITKVKEKIQKMREKMFKKYFDEKKKDMEAICKDKTDDVNAKLALISREKGDDFSENKEKFRECVIEALFYVNRLKSLSKQEAFKLKPGESCDEAFKRLDAKLEPTEAEKKEIRENEFVDQMVNEGYEDFLGKSDYSTDDIINLNKKIVRLQGDKIRQQRLRDEQTNKNIEQNKEKERKKELSMGEPGQGPMTPKM